ncbi:MAG: baseplate J/gp47 family protein, partial [Thermodesulfobacteriota bacterium]
MKTEPPKIDYRKFSDLLNALKGLVPHYTPEWAASDEKDSGVALLKIFSHIVESVVSRLNQVPRKNFVAFLDMLGIEVLSAQSSRVALSFKLAKGTEKDILIPGKTQAAADKTEEHDELPFETEKNLWATTSPLNAVISVDPFKDNIFVHTASVLSKDGEVLDEQKAFTVFSGIDQQEHSLYLGHKDLFNIESTG